MLSHETIIECTPNVSEGKDQQVIDAIAKAISSTPDCILVGVDPSYSANRTVYTFFGSPSSIVEGAINAARVIAKMINMENHHGEHPRFGAMDTCPFMPIRNATMDQCVQCAKEFGQRLSQELDVPVYLSEYASSHKYRYLVVQIRTEYENLEERLADPRWKPDFGPDRFIPRWGATIAVAGNGLIAFNINIISTKEQAHKIALNIREKGRSPQEPGRLKMIQALGWYLYDENIAQVSTNVLDYRTTPLHVVFEEVKKDAKELKLPIVGSQIVSLVSLDAILATADYYIKKDNLLVLTEQQKIMLVVERLGLNSLGHFNPQEKIIEYILKLNQPGPLVSKGVNAFINSFADRTNNLEGGTAAATTAAIGAALACMGCLSTYGNRKFESLDSIMRPLIVHFHQSYQKLITLIDKHAEAVIRYQTLLTKSKSNKKCDKSISESNLQESLLKLIEIELTILQLSEECWPPLLQLAHHCNQEIIHDLQTGCRTLISSIWGINYKLTSNIKKVTDNTFKDQKLQEIENRILSTSKQSTEILGVLQSRIL